MILVTGGTGLVGSHLLFDLINSGEKVRALKRKSSNLDNVKNVFGYYSDNANDLFNKIEWADGDVLDIFSLEDAMKDVSEIYHCAGMVSFEPGNEKFLMKVNVNGTANVVNIALDKKIKKLCYVSSISSLGRAEHDGFVDEQTHWVSSNKNSHYSVSKYGGEREVWRGIEEGLDAVIVNPSIILGPGNWNSGSSRVFTSVLKGLKFYTVGVNGFVDVRDVSKAMVQLMESKIKNERFILNSENISYQKLFNLIAKYLGKKPPTIHAGKFLSAVVWREEKIRSFITGSKPFITKETARTANSTYRYSTKKIETKLNFEFIPIEKTIKDSAELFLKDADNKKL